MMINRRSFAASGVGLALMAGVARAAGKVASPVSGAEGDQTAALQAAIDDAAARRVPLVLPPGVFATGSL
ncbi:hypothetical protein, partial [Acinetobacter baumannii]